MTTFFLGLVLLMFCLPVRADTIRTAGDWLQIGIPAFALGRAHGLGDSEGVRDMGHGILTNMLATQSIKIATDQTRPDGGKLSFPSGHTSAAFQGAAFLHRRYGWHEAWPHYLAAGFVGYSRVHARRHHWRDVIGGAAVGIGSSWLTTTPFEKNALTLALEGDSVQARYIRTW